MGFGTVVCARSRIPVIDEPDKCSRCVNLFWLPLSLTAILWVCSMRSSASDTPSSIFDTVTYLALLIHPVIMS